MSDSIVITPKMCDSVDKVTHFLDSFILLFRLGAQP